MDKSPNHYTEQKKLHTHTHTRAHTQIRTAVLFHFYNLQEQVKLIDDDQRQEMVVIQMTERRERRHK